MGTGTQLCSQEEKQKHHCHWQKLCTVSVRAASVQRKCAYVQRHSWVGPKGQQRTWQYHLDLRLGPWRRCLLPL